jgi:hypothetical protein
MVRRHTSSRKLKPALLVVAYVLSTLCALPANAAGVQPTPIPRDPRPDFSQFQFLVGNWNCTIDSSRRPRPFPTTVRTSIDSNGYWLLMKTTTGKVPWNPIAIATTDSLTYDATTSRWIDISMDDYGAYDVSASPGWSGNALVWSELATQKLHGLTSTSPRTMTKVTDDKTTTDQAFVETSGRRVTVNTTCIRATAGT